MNIPCLAGLKSERLYISLDSTAIDSESPQANQCLEVKSHGNWKLIVDKNGWPDRVMYAALA